MKQRTRLFKGCFVLLQVSLLLCGLTACGNAATIQAQANQAVSLRASGSMPEQETTAIGQTYFVQDAAPKESVSYAVYEPFGLLYDQSNNELYFEGELVRYFYDGVDLGDEMASVYCDYLNEKGTVDVYAIRESGTNEDGSYNPFGELAGIERYSQEEFDKRDLSDFYGSSGAVTYAFGFYDPTAESFTERFAKYKGFGVEYVEAETASGAGNIYYNGQLVNNFLDITPGGGIFSFHSADGGDISLQTVYENGELVGVKEVN